MPEIRLHDDVKALGEAIIAAAHPFLRDAYRKPKIAYCMLYADTASDIGKVKKIGDDIKTTTQGAPDFIITVWYNWWEDAKPDQRRAMMDHLLCHVGFSVTDGKTWLRQHDFEGFRGEIERHGAWSAELQSAQVKLFGEEDAADVA